MAAILNAIENHQITNVGKVVVISNRDDAAGLQIAKKHYGVVYRNSFKKKLNK